MQQLRIFDSPEIKDTDIVDSREKEISLKIIHNSIPDVLENNSYLNVFRKSEKSIHNIALYPCKYIPELPNWAIRNFSSEGDFVLDPFCGGGTTLIESRKLNRNIYGFDYNPYAVLISRVKSSFYEQDKLRSILSKLLSCFLRDKEFIESPNWKGIDFWFNPEVIRGLNVIKKHVNQIQDSSYRDFYKVVFSMVVRKSSYIAPGQILTARRKDWKECIQYSENDVYDMFRQYSSEYITYAHKFELECRNSSSQVIVDKTDARNIITGRPIDLIVASPPYINSMDYVWANRLRIHWLDLVDSDADRLNLYEEEIGTERIKSKEYAKLGVTGYSEIDNTISEIYNAFDSNQQSQLRARVVYKYFKDMEDHFTSAYKSLKDGGKYCIVIGDNTIRKVNVRTTDYLSQIASQVGFKKEFQFNILLKNRSLNVERKLDFADLIKYDRMIVLSK